MTLSARLSRAQQLAEPVHLTEGEFAALCHAGVLTDSKLYGIPAVVNDVLAVVDDALVEA